MKRITAKFAGNCADCTVRIQPGDAILWGKDTETRHAACPVAAKVREIPKQFGRVPCSDVHALMHRALGQLKRPKIKLQTSTRRNIILCLRVDSLDRDGYISVVDDVPYGTRHSGYFGVINGNGVWDSVRDVPEDVRLAVVEFGINPESTASAYGRRVGSCCFCSRDLTDEKSTTAGYGPTCAKRYSLPWGVTSAEEASTPASENSFENGEASTPTF